MKKTFALSLAAFALMAAPSLAAPLCTGTYALDPEIFTEAQIADFYHDALRGAGVDAVRTEIWGGCIRAFVRLDDGREEMQFFDPAGLRRVG